MWKTLSQSVPGTSHQRSGQPCQDNCATKEIVLPGETVLLLVCSDGAGSAELSQIGSLVACQTALAVMGSEIRDAKRLKIAGPEQGVGWMRQVHKAIGAEADSRDIEMRQLACTLLFAVVGQSGAAFGQIGDGAIVAWQNGEYQQIFWPQSGEYANTTNFVTDPRFPSYFQFAWCDHAIDELALFTDGLQMLGLDFQQQRAHGPFFAPMFDSLRKHPNSDDLIAPMRTFLESPAITERTDDDKTLMLATRMAGS